MIAISSHRPHGARSPMYARNQIRGIKSWQPYFKKTLLFGPYTRSLANLGNVQFIESENFPFIHTLAAEAGRQDTDYVALINADIVVTQPIRKLPEIMAASKITGCSSRRKDLHKREYEKDDRGRDIFICTPGVWRMVAKNIPRNCRIGHQQWDSWMIAFMRRRLQNHYGDFTPIGCVYHPKHGDRKMPHAATIDISRSPYQIDTFRHDPQMVLNYD